jgi:hypothetical protein
MQNMQTKRNYMPLNIFTLLVMLTTAAATIEALTGQNQALSGESQEAEREKKRKEFESQFAVADLEEAEPADPQQLAKRKAKSKRYDKLGLVSKQVPDYVDETALYSHWQENLPAFPVEQSHAIIIGETLDSQAHLSNDKSGVYTESSVRISEILKQDSSSSLVSGAVISVDRPGGFVKYPNGRKVLYRVVGLNMLRVRKQYVLFLGDASDGGNYRVITGYELMVGGVSPLDEAAHFDKYRGMAKTPFLNAVCAAIAPPQQIRPNE